MFSISVHLEWSCYGHFDDFLQFFVIQDVSHVGILLLLLVSTFACAGDYIAMTIASFLVSSDT